MCRRDRGTGLRGLRRMSRWVPMPTPQEEYTVNHLVRFPSNRDAVELAASVFLPGNDLGRQSADNVGRDAASSSSSDSSPPSSSRQGVVMVHAHPNSEARLTCCSASQLTWRATAFAW